MPILKIEMFEGRTEEQKRKLITGRELSKRSASSRNKPLEDVVR